MITNHMPLRAARRKSRFKDVCSLTKVRILTRELNLCEMALVKNDARNGTVYCHDSKEILVHLCLLPPESLALYWDLRFR